MNTIAQLMSTRATQAQRDTVARMSPPNPEIGKNGLSFISIY